MKKLQSLDRSFTVIPDPKKVPSSKKATFYVSSVPRELDLSFQEVLAAAQGPGYVSRAALAALPHWGPERAKQTLAAMVQEGVCLVDEGDASGATLFWFPVLSALGNLEG